MFLFFVLGEWLNKIIEHVSGWNYVSNNKCLFVIYCVFNYKHDVFLFWRPNDSSLVWSVVMISILPPMIPWNARGLSARLTEMTFILRNTVSIQQCGTANS